MKEFFSTPFTTKDVHHVELAVLVCIDPRFRKFDQQAIEEGLGIKNFDLFRWPGVTRPIITSAEFFILFYQAIENVSIKLHQIKKLLLLCHWDCGAYGGSVNYASASKEEQKYQSDLRQAKDLLRRKFPDLEILVAYSKDEGGILHYYLVE